MYLTMEIHMIEPGHDPGSPEHKCLYLATEIMKWTVEVLDQTIGYCDNDGIIKCFPIGLEWNDDDPIWDPYDNDSQSSMLLDTLHATVKFKLISITMCDGIWSCKLFNDASNVPLACFEHTNRSAAICETILLAKGYFTTFKLYEMKMSDSTELNIKHATNPEPGDYWNEHLMGICVVLAVVHGHVIICKTKIDVDDGKSWTWDLSVTDSMTISDFNSWLSYDSGIGYWADVNPNAHKWVLEDIKIGDENE